ncbi:hypothetical protein GCM10020366_10630 [Saccharopolyspora gregorii]|uniref:DNA polymerase III gamma subunit domain-containing protein n=1 Tax=Saccharopolyspora gregorii TaxID=33914 RepID=A0ABP6RJB7_9PSEU
MLLHAVPDAGGRGLIDAAGDELTKMQTQSEQLGAATLSRFAEIVHTGLQDMRGATAPRLLLELLCARMMLPAASESEGALLQRVEQVERRMTLAPPAAADGSAAPAAPAAPAAATGPAAAAPRRGRVRRQAGVPAAQRPADRGRTEAPAQQAPAPQARLRKPPPPQAAGLAARKRNGAAARVPAARTAAARIQHAAAPPPAVVMRALARVYRRA